MSLRLKSGVRIFIYNQSIDMRAGFNKLQSLVTDKMKGNLYEGHLFVFLGKNRRRIKMLLFDGTGLILTTKRLDRGSFMKIADLFETQEITLEDLDRLLDGANLRVLFAAEKGKRDQQIVA
jgi:transposase